MSVSVLIPARNEQFLPQTIDDLCAKAQGEMEIIAILDGYWPVRVSEDSRVSYIHFTEPRGMRNGLNAACEIAKGDFVMKLDAHCMVSEGFDVALSKVCQENWVCVPTRKRLDAENWRVREDNRPDVNYLFIDLDNDGLNGKVWHQKNVNRDLDAVRIDDLIACQGSCYFMPRALWRELELLDVENYGTFRKDPQEVLFKCWTNGGRCVRVKDAWYAHLHKGRTYGRGYSTSTRDWDKGDEYVKRWWTDSAWDKQKIPLRDVIRAHFADMPGWESHEWITGADLPKPALPNTYQVLQVGSEPFSAPKPRRTESQFWNEGRWHTFIAPLLPENVKDHTFVEMGANAGLFCKLAKDRGYRHAIGIEKNRTPVRIGLEWRDTLGGDWQLLKRKLGGSFGEAGTFDIDELPVADVTLMSAFHYYIDINAWVKYLDRLAAKTCSVLIVSRPELDNGHWMAQADLASVRGYFSDWIEADTIDDVDTDDDPNPRDLYAVLFRSRVVHRVDIDSIDARESESDPMYAAMMALAQLIATGQPFDVMSTDYVARWRNRKRGDWSERVLRRFIDLKVDVMKSIRDVGQMDPLIVQCDGLRLSDGGHRLAMLKALDYKTAIVRRI